MKISDFISNCKINFSSWMLITSMIFPTTFNRSIVHIVFLCSNPKMIGVYARPIIGKWTAIMTNIFSFWNVPFMKFVRKSMSEAFKQAIPSSIFRSFPYPTMFSFFNMRKKSLIFWKPYMFTTSFASRISEKFTAFRTIHVLDYN